MPPALIRHLCVLCGLLGWPVLTLAQDLRPVWAQGAQGDFAAALGALPERDGGDEAVFAKAMLWFNRQPRSDDHLSAAAALLAGLARDGATAELRARSLYFQARAEMLLQPDGPASVALYERLWRDYPDEPYGQRGLVHLLLMTFYRPGDSDLDGIAAVETQADRLTDPVVRSQFHQVAARGYLHLGGNDERALEHLLQVATLGMVRREALGDLHVSIGQLAAQLGRTKVAHAHFTAFLREFPNDPRAFTVQQKLSALSGSPW